MEEAPGIIQCLYLSTSLTCFKNLFITYTYQDKGKKPPDVKSIQRKIHFKAWPFIKKVGLFSPRKFQRKSKSRSKSQKRKIVQLSSLEPAPRCHLGTLKQYKMS